MATREVFSEDELAQLRGFPEPARAELIRYFTLTPADEAFARKFRRRDNVLGVAVQLCTLPWLGFVPDDVPAAPAAAVARLSQRLGIPVGALRGYGARGQTRTDHLRDVAAYLGWRQMDGPRWKDLEEFLFARAMEHDSPKLLFRQACEYLSSSRLIRPGVVNILERVMLPRVPIASVLVEIDARTGFTDHLVHAGGKVSRAPELKRNLLYVIIAEATNMGLSAMAESCGVPYDVLAWTAEWYFRPETLEAANAAIVNYHHRLPMTQAFGTGTLSSSDGQRFPVKGRSLTARHLSRYFARGQGVSTYTHVSDQHSTFDTKVIAATAPESPYVLDGILGNQTDLQVTEHATDTHGATLANFALFDLVGLQLSPRIRDLGKITLYRTGPRAGFVARYPSAGHLLTRRVNDGLITAMWDDLLRVAASVKGGHASAALVVGKLCSSMRQQTALAAAIKEYGALRRTVYAARYLADETYRRRVGRQLNKGENVHALKRSLAYAGEGALRRRHHEQQAEQMWCLTLAANAVVTWTTEYNGLAVTALRRAGRDIDDAVLAHIWPTHHENVHFYGTHSVDVAGELAQLDADGYRPLRVPAPPLAGGM